ncbi:hypothetical protein DSO57_1033563 [Entomophthora muscae]|uniref:Uncharacterized protein n=2 Tax=Entomophthora muscae TaxID=34485 RepID=A0ACC2S275_9FUNG|nr:hypothetical protein DSO57_1033563 [Entomophthora muscae]
MSRLLVQRIFLPKSSIFGQQAAYHLRKKPKKFVALPLYPTFDKFFAPITKDVPAGVNAEFFTMYAAVMDAMAPETFVKKSFSTCELTELTSKIQTREELQLMPELLERWRRRNLVYSEDPSKKLFLLAQAFRAPDVAFRMVADRHLYGLAPRTVEMNRLLKMYAREGPHLISGSTELSEIEPWGEKMVMTYGLMQYYKCVPDQTTADVLISALLKSPLGSYWGVRITKLARELSEFDLIFSDRTLALLAKCRSEYNDTKAQVESAAKE